MHLGSEDESEGKEEKNEDKPSKPEKAWEGLEGGKNAYTKIVETVHEPRLQAKLNTYRTRGKVAIEAGNTRWP